MKKILLFFAALLMIALLTVSVLAASTVVYVDGTVSTAGDGTTPETALKTFAAGIKALPNGGTMVICGDTSITAATQVAATTGCVTVTSEYNGIEYDAVFNLGARLVFTGDVTFDNITINNASTAQQSIFARGYTLTIGEGVTCTTNGGELIYPMIYGGKYNGAHTGDSHVIIKGGTWRAVYGGNYTNSFTGNSVVDFLGGEILFALAGGNYAGNFAGDCTVNIGGDAVMRFNSVSSINVGIVGGTTGDGLTSETDTMLTHTGDITVNIFGDAQVYSNVLGAAARADVTTKGDITIDIYGNADLYRHVYGGGWYGNTETNDGGIVVTVRENATFTNPGMSNYVCAGAQQGTVRGNVKVVVKDNAYIPGNVCVGGNAGVIKGNSVAEMYGGVVSVNFTAGTRIGTVEGNTTTVAYGGKIGYHSSGNFALRGNGGYASATSYGTVTGTATVTLDGADVAGDVTLGGAAGTVTLKSGKAGSAPDTSLIDLSAGGSLTIGGNVNASELIGGGSVTIGNASSITAEKMSGDTTIIIEGTPTAGATYVTVADTASEGTVSYTPVADEILTKNVGEESITYTVNYPDRYETTKVRIYYYNPHGTDETQPDLVLYKGLASSDNREKLSPAIGSEDGKAYAEADLAPGVYYYKVYYGNGVGDYHIKYFYISGKVEKLTYDQPYEPYVADSYMEAYTATTTDEVLKNFFTTDTIDGYVPLDTPTFTKHTMDDRSYMSNAELCEYADALDAECEYLYVYYPFKDSVMGNQYPILVFTKDAISENATFDEVGEIVRGGGVREILMVSGGVHGNEPVGIEGVLAFANALTGDYGAEVMNSFGAIVLMPSVSADNFQRFKRLNSDGINPQRDLLQLTGEGTQNQVYVYKTFMPTVYIDCHTDTGTLKVSEDDNSVSYPAINSLSHLDDAVIRYASVFNSPIIDVSAIADGTAPVSEQIGMQINVAAIEALKEQGLRSGFYYFPNAKPNTSWVYAQARGSYGFLIESMRIWSGKDRYERSVYSMMQAIKAITDEVVNYDGALAQNVYDGRAAAVVSEYDADNVFAKKTTASGNLVYTVERMSIYLDGTVKGSDIVTITHHDTVSDFVPMATAYVIDADAESIDTILNILDIHGIKYTKIRNGATLNLRKYAGIDTVNTSSEAVTFGDAESVTFENGAYVVTLDTSDSYLITYLFEPDSFPYTLASDHMHSFANMGYLTDSDSLYRSETSGVADIVASLIAIEGDVDGDGDVDISDVMAALKAVVNGDKFTLLDVLRILKLAVI